MTQPTAGGPLSEAQRALASAFAEGFAAALQSPFNMLANLLRQANENHAELVAAVDRLTQVIGAAAAAQAAGDIDPDDAPEIEMPLERFHNFDWATIGAQVLAEDEYGPAIISYGGKAFKRRSPDNQFDPAIWFSRAVGKDDAGKNKYVRLITFKPMSDKVEPMGRKAERAVSSAPPAGAPAPAAAGGAPVYQPRPAAPAVQPPQQPPARRATAGSAGAPAAASVQPALPEEPEMPTWCEWCGERPALPGVPCDPCRRLAATAENRPQQRTTAEAEFDSWTSASEGKPPLQSKPPLAGPRVSGGTHATENAQPPVAGKPASAPAQATGARPATIGAGDAYKRFGQWAGEFAARYTYYAAEGGRPNYPKLLASIAGVGQKLKQDFGHVTVENFDAIKAAMEQHAKTHHAN